MLWLLGQTLGHAIYALIPQSLPSLVREGLLLSL